MLVEFVKTCTKDALKLEAIRLIMVLDGDLNRSALSEDAASIQSQADTAASNKTSGSDLSELEQLLANSSEFFCK
jgi:hypothetical protein